MRLNVSNTLCGYPTNRHKILKVLRLFIRLILNQDATVGILTFILIPFQNEKSLLGELLKHILGVGSRSLQALGFTLISRTKLFIPDSRRSYYNEKANKLLEDMTVSKNNTKILFQSCS